MQRRRLDRFSSFRTRKVWFLRLGFARCERLQSLRGWTYDKRVAFGEPSGDVQRASRSFLFRVAAVLGFVLAAVGFTTCRGNASLSATTSTIFSSSSVPVDVANLAPPTTAGPSVLTAGQRRPAQTLPESAIPEIGLGTPQAAARNLWDAWRDRDRTRALLYATPKAVSKLFAWTWVPQIRQAGCTPIESSTKTAWLCRFEGPKQRWDSTIGGDPKLGFRVVGLQIGDPVGDLVQPDSLPSVTNLLPSSTNPDGSPAEFGPAAPVDFSTTTAPGSATTGSTTGSTDAISGAGSEAGSGASQDVSSTSVTTTVPTSVPQGTRSAKRKPKLRTTVTRSKVSRAKPVDSASSPDTQPKKVPKPEPAPKPDPPAEKPVDKPADNGPVPVQEKPAPVVG